MSFRSEKIHENNRKHAYETHPDIEVDVQSLHHVPGDIATLHRRTYKHGSGQSKPQVIPKVEQQVKLPKIW
jgi:hypothetical protein